MKILTWNIRGAGRKGFVHQVCKLIKNYHLDILVLLETKVNLEKSNLIIKRFNYPYFVEIFHGLLGGLWVI